MQQTEKYQLNLIETSDTFSPAALNENAQKTEAAIEAARAEAADAADALAEADDALDARVTVLEATKLVFGTYVGKDSSSTQTIDLGFTPKAVVVVRADTGTSVNISVMGSKMAYKFDLFVQIVENGFSVGDSCNSSGNSYKYMALG